MEDQRKREMEIILPASEIAPFFKKIGDDLAAGALRLGETGIDLSGLEELRLVLRKEAGSCLVRLRLKGAGPGRSIEEPDGECLIPTDSSGRMKYKCLKKRMKADFKTIRESLDSGRMPGEAVLEAFIADARLMCTYEDMGEEHYPAFMDQVERFGVAVRSGDVAAASLEAEGLRQLKKECHARYK